MQEPVNHELNDLINQVKEPAEIKDEFKNQIDTVGTLMKQIVELIATLDDNPNEKDKELDEKITQLILHLKTVKEFYSITPLLKPDEQFPTTTGNFENFIKRVIFNSSGEKLTQYVPDSVEKDKIWKLDLVDLVVGLAINRSIVPVRDIKDKKDHSILTDKAGLVLPPPIVLREQLKTEITAHLKNDIHHCHTLQSYKNDKLYLTQAPVVFRGGNLNDSLIETKIFAKKMTRVGEYSVDSHLLVGQENNIKKHEVRSGIATTFAATGVGSARAVTDKFDIALKFGGMTEVKILYVVRGKESFHSHPFAKIVGKKKLGEIAYTHINPQDYLMTILYDRNNVILDVIPGNLNGEIQGINELTKRVLVEGIDFYNYKHNASLTYKSIVKLPSPTIQMHTISHLPKKKPLLDIIHAHKTESSSLVKMTPSTSQFGSIRITRNVRDGNKILSLGTLRPEVESVQPSNDKLVIPDDSFRIVPGRLNEVREATVAHYNMRHVLTLKGFNRWSIQERKLQETYNRILQPNFMEGALHTQLMHADIAHEEKSG